MMPINCETKEQNREINRKRSHSEDGAHNVPSRAIKRAKKSSAACHFSQVVDDVILKICGYLRLGDLAAIAQLSSKYKNLAYAAPVWTQLCQKAKVKWNSSPRLDFLLAVAQFNPYAHIAYGNLLAKNLHLPARPSSALNYFHFALEDENFEANNKNRINLKKIRLYVDFPMIAQPFVKCLACLKNILLCPQSTQGEKIKASLLRTKIFVLQSDNLYGLANPPTDDQVDARLKSLIQNKDLITPSLRAEAELLRCHLFFQNRCNNLKRDEIDRIICSLCENRDARASTRAEAKLLQYQLNANSPFLLAIMKNPDQLLQGIAQNHYAHPETRAHADLARIRFWIREKHHGLTGDSADQLLQSYSQKQSLDPSTRAEADLLLGYLTVERLNDRLTPDQADLLLKSVSENGNAKEDSRADADVGRALLRVKNLCATLTGDQADQLLKRVDENHSACKTTRAKANLACVRLWKEGLCNRLNISIAHNMLRTIETNYDLHYSTRNEATALCRELKLKSYLDVISSI